MSSNNFTLTLPSDWKEAYINVAIGSNSSYCVPVSILHRDMLTTNHSYRAGYAKSATSEFAEVIVTCGMNDTINLAFVFGNGNDVKNSSYGTVYAKTGYIYI